MLGLWVIWPLAVRLLRPVVQRWAAHKAEDYIRRAAGMPPREKGKHKKPSAATDDTGDYARDFERRRQRRQQNTGEPLIPKEYAVDVEYVEYKDRSETIEVAPDPKTGKPRFKAESQVSDAEYVMVKPHRGK